MSNIVIIGSGPAGVSAALYAARAGVDTTVLTKGPGALDRAELIQNYYGFAEPISGAELERRGMEGARAVGVKFVTAEAVGLTYTDKLTVETLDGDYPADAVILATGASRAAPRIPGLTGLEGHGVSYCAACDGAFFRGKDVAVVGGGNSAVSEALLLSRLCRHVTLVHRRSTFRASAAELAALEKQDNVTFCRNSTVTELLGRERLTGIRLQNGRELEISGLFVCIGRTPVSALGGEQLRRTPDGYYCADETTRTGLPGVFAAGDVREKQLRQIVTAVSDGAAAAQQAEHYLGKTSRRAEI